MATDLETSTVRESMFENGNFGFLVVCAVPFSVFFTFLLLAL